MQDSALIDTKSYILGIFSNTLMQFYPIPFFFLMTITPNRTYQNMFVMYKLAALQTASMSGCEFTCFMHPNHQ